MVLSKCTDQFTDFDNLLWIETNGRFIQDDNIREIKNCSGKTCSLAITFGKVFDQSVFHINKFDQFHNFYNLCIAVSFRNFF